MSNHTPEPWFADGVHIAAATHDIYAQSIAVMINDGNLTINQKEANAARIVSCVNSCAGINPEAVPELLALAQVAAALDTHGDPENYVRGIKSAARAALAKAQ